jgi:hypothetical protein
MPNFSQVLLSSGEVFLLLIRFSEISDCLTAHNYKYWHQGAAESLHLKVLRTSPPKHIVNAQNWKYDSVTGCKPFLAFQHGICVVHCLCATVAYRGTVKSQSYKVWLVAPLYMVLNYLFPYDKGSELAKYVLYFKSRKQ